MRNFIIALFVLMLAGCASQRIASTHRMDSDVTYASARRLDSLFRAIFQRDSIYRRDSIYIREKGDTVTHYVERILYQWRTRTDTLYRDRWRTDTLYVERRDSVMVERPVYVEKPVKWYNQGFIWLGKLCCLAAILWALFLYLKRKF